MTRKVTGGCLCGAVRYEFDRGRALSAHHCHCSDCRRSSGAGKATVLFLPADALGIEGELRSFTVVGSAGSHVNRFFCPTCGSPILSRVDEQPDLSFIKVGSLDDSSWIRIESSYWSGSAEPWSPVDPDAPCFPGNPEN